MCRKVVMVLPSARENTVIVKAASVKLICQKRAQQSVQRTAQRKEKYANIFDGHLGKSILYILAARLSGRDEFLAQISSRSLAPPLTQIICIHSTI